MLHHTSMHSLDANLPSANCWMPYSPPSQGPAVAGRPESIVGILSRQAHRQALLGIRAIGAIDIPALARALVCPTPPPWRNRWLPSASTKAISPWWWMSVARCRGTTLEDIMERSLAVSRRHAVDARLMCAASTALSGGWHRAGAISTANWIGFAGRHATAWLDWSSPNRGHPIPVSVSLSVTHSRSCAASTIRSPRWVYPVKSPAASAGVAPPRGAHERALPG